MTSRAIVITGGTAGIGKAIALELLERGNRVYICGRNSDKLHSVLNELRNTYHNRVNGSTCDVCNFSEVEKMMHEANSFLGKIDVLINNAGIGYIKSIMDIDPKDWNQIISTNLTGVFNATKLALPFLKKNTNSDIINMGSRSGRYSFKGGVGYNTTKFGLQGFTEALFLDLSEFGVRVSLVAPGTVSTGFGGGTQESWHLMPEDIACIVADILNLNKRAAVNWLEIRPAKPK
jgi:3-oxoacyl-[acyl-carrier protein] reductase